MKTCTMCKETKDLSCFGKASWGKDGKNSRCLLCHNEHTKAWRSKNVKWTKAYASSYYQENKDLVRCRSLQKKYGITQEEYDTMFEDQGRVCKVCGTSNDLSKGAFPVDHCHITGEVRGVLCHPCNKALGLVNDNKETLQNLIKYLDKRL